MNTSAHSGMNWIAVDLIVYLEMRVWSSLEAYLPPLKMSSSQMIIFLRDICKPGKGPTQLLLIEIPSLWPKWGTYHRICLWLNRQITAARTKVPLRCPKLRSNLSCKLIQRDLPLSPNLSFSQPIKGVNHLRLAWHRSAPKRSLRSSASTSNSRETLSIPTIRRTKRNLQSTTATLTQMASIIGLTKKLISARNLQR